MIRSGSARRATSCIMRSLFGGLTTAVLYRGLLAFTGRRYYASGFVPFAPRRDSLASQLDALHTKFASTPKPTVQSTNSASGAQQPGSTTSLPVDGTSNTLTSADTADAISHTPQVLITCLRNNIFIVVSSSPGRTLFRLNAGIVGFRGGQKTSHKAAMAILDVLHRRLADLGIHRVSLNFRGINGARGVMVGQLRSSGLQITEICDSTRIPFNGCRPKKTRRL